MTEENKQGILVKSLVAYGIFGVLQVFYRFWWGWSTSSRMRRMLKDVPAFKGENNDLPGGWITGLRRNFHRMHDWRLDISEGLPVAKLLGFSWTPAPYSLIANDPAIVRHILKDEFNKYTKSDAAFDPFAHYFEDFLGDGIFVVKHGLGAKDGGQEWSQMRKVSAQIFTRKNFNSMMQEVFVSKAELLRKFLQKSTNGEPVDIQSCFFNFTFDARLAFGVLSP